MKNTKGPKYSLPKKITDKKFSGLRELIDWVVENGVDPNVKLYYSGKYSGQKVQDFLKF